MIPPILIHQQLMFERCRSWQRAMAELRRAAGLSRECQRLPRRKGATIGGFLIKLCSSLKQLEVHER
ncbi:MAG TPA: hypothetical protein VKR83_14685 [Ktedonobacteraceae bacterium]|nr:hypothetical protein [Ktedonobacteraceae bacterium]